MKTRHFRSALSLRFFAFPVLLSLAVLAAAPASAQQSSVYLSGAVGQADWGNVDIGRRSLDGPGAGSISGRAAGGQEFSYGLDLGYRFNNMIAIELGYGDFGKADLDPAGSGGSLSAKSVAVSAVLTYPVGRDFSVFGQFGAARTRRTVDQAFVSGTVGTGEEPTVTSGTMSFRENKTEAIYGVGASYAFNEQAQVFARYQRLADTRIDVLQIGTRISF